MKLSSHDWEALARAHGTPLYLYDLDQAQAHLQELQDALQGVSVYYCVKANPNRAVIEAFRDMVPALDISSAGELELAASVGWDPGKMSFAGPGKSDRELATALERGIGSLSIESAVELNRISTLAQRSGIVAPVLLRINPEFTPRAFAMKMGGGPSQFGVPEEQAEATLRQAIADPHLHVRGIHIFAGTQCLDPEALEQNLQQTLSIAARLSEACDLTMEEVNLGGGLGIAYFQGQEDLDNQALARRLAGCVREFRESHARFAATHFVLELGRYLMGRYGAYLSRVIEVKHVRDKRFVVLDGGMNHVFPATGNFGQLIKKNYPVVNVSRTGDEAPAVKQEIVGPLCTPMDSLGRGLELVPCEVGDLLAFDNCGAYSFSASPLLFLSHPSPAELVHYQGQVRLARRRLAPADFY